MKSTDYIDELLARHLANESLTSTQEVELEEWINKNKTLFGQISALYAKDTASAPDIEFDTHKAWSKVEARIMPEARRVSLNFRTIGIAASVLCVLGLTLFGLLRDETQTLHYTNNSAIQNEVILPDQSIVKLYPGATVKYKSGKKKGDRILSLRGQAFFNVKKLNGRPFIVDAYNTQVRVLGTSFFVDAIALNKTDIKVKTGKVSVTNNERNVILTANEQVSVTADSMIKSQIPGNTPETSARPAVLKFSNTPIETVIKQLETIFRVKIELEPKLKQNTITTTVHTDSLENILTELTYLSKSKFQKLSDKKYKIYVE